MTLEMMLRRPISRPGTNRRLVGNLLTAAILLVTVLPGRVANAGPMEVLLGPVAPLGAPTSVPRVVAYDGLQVSKGRLYAAGFPQYPDDLPASNFYDLALALYHLHARTGDVYWRDRARSVARAWRDHEWNQNIARRLVDWRTTSAVPQPFYMSTLGLALYALDADDPGARRIVNDQARLVKEYWPTFNGDPRNAGYALMALVAATVLGHDHRTAAKANVDSLLSGERSGGCWEGVAPKLVPAGPFVLNYMNGLVMEALILYDRAFGD